MIKAINTILLVLLMSACSSEEKKETTPLATTSEVVQTQTVEKTEPKQPIKEAPVTKSETIKSEPQKEPLATTSALKKSILTIKTIDGKMIHIDEAEAGLTFQEFKGKGVIVLFFGYRCPPCLHEIPSLIALMNKKHPDLEIIAIEVQGLNPEELQTFKKQKGINYNLAVQYGNNSQFIQYIGAKAQWGGSIPFLVAFDKKGEVKVVHVGGLGSSQLDMIYKSLSGEK